MTTKTRGEAGAGVAAILLLMAGLVAGLLLRWWSAADHSPPRSPDAVVVVHGGVSSPAIRPEAGAPAAAPAAPAPLARDADGTRIDPALAGAIGAASPDLRMLHDQLAAETRDASRAEARQQSVRGAFAAFSALAPASPLRVTCAATMCEVVGRIAPGRAGGFEAAIEQSRFQDMLTDRNMSMGPAELLDRSPDGATFVAYVMAEGETAI